MTAETLALIVHIAAIAVIVVLTAACAVIGFMRGIQRQVIRAVTVIVSAVLAIIGTKISGKFIIGFFDGKTVEGMLSFVEGLPLVPELTALAWLKNFDIIIVKYVSAIPISLIVLPVLFVAIFAILMLVLEIVHKIVCGILGFRKRELNLLKRGLGFVLGLVQGAAISIVVLVPAIGLATATGNAVEAIRANENKTDNEISFLAKYDASFKGVIDGPVSKTVGFLGGNFLYDYVTSVELDGKNVVMKDQATPVLAVYLDYASGLRGADYTSLTEANKAAIRDIIDELGGSEYFAPLTAGLVRGVAFTIADTEIIASMEEPLKSVAASLLDILKTSDGSNLSSDLDTFCELYFLLSDSGMLKSFTGGEEAGASDPLKLLSAKDESGKTALSKAVDILSANDRTKPVVSTLTKASISMLGSVMAPNGESIAPDEAYESVKTGLTEAVKIKESDYDSTEEYHAAVSDILENVLIENNILTNEFVDANREKVDEVLSAVTTHITENYGGNEELTDEDVTKIVLEYYEAYVNGDLESLIGKAAVPAA